MKLPGWYPKLGFAMPATSYGSSPEKYPVRLQPFGDAFLIDLCADDLANLGVHLRKSPRSSSFVSEARCPRRQALLPRRREGVLVANREDAAPATAREPFRRGRNRLVERRHSRFLALSADKQFRLPGGCPLHVIWQYSSSSSTARSRLCNQPFLSIATLIAQGS
jgi:hypothetical protein